MRKCFDVRSRARAAPVSECERPPPHCQHPPHTKSPQRAPEHDPHGASLAEAVRADHPVEDDRSHAKAGDNPHAMRHAAAPLEEAAVPPKA